MELACSYGLPNRCITEEKVFHLFIRQILSSSLFAFFLIKDKRTVTTYFIRFRTVTGEKGVSGKKEDITLANTA